MTDATRIHRAPEPKARQPLHALQASAGEPADVRDWLRVQHTLLQAERELADTAERYARGEVTLEQLDAVSEKTVALRELSLAVLQRLRRG